ncbi:peptidase U32 family [Firmicutes bacterium CAG:137]|nr:peptidase U32 family [Firmicutes bacterium CAG:137]
MIRDCGTCRSLVLNGKKLYWLDRREDWSGLGLYALRLLFTTENPQEVDRVLRAWETAAPFAPGGCTRGLYLRGVE